MPQSTMIHRPERWDNPFDPEMTEDSVDRVLTLKPFVAMNPADFPPTAPLRDIIRNDMRFQSFSDGDFVVRRGDFGTTSYVIVSGHCLVVLPPGLPDEFLGRAKVKKKGFFQALWQLWENPRTPEATDPADVSADSKKRLETLSDVPGAASPKGVTVSLSNYKTHRMNPGDMFGEIAALARSGRTTSVLAEGDVEVLEIRRQGVRDVRRFVEAFRTRVDKLYRSNSLKVQLPNGVEIELASDVGGSGDNFTGTTFDDQSATSITAGTAPFTGSFRPEGLLSTFNGINALGSWELRVFDDAGADIGNLDSWSLELGYAPLSCVPRGGINSTTRSMAAARVKYAAGTK